MHLPLLATILGVDTSVFVFAIIVILVAVGFDYVNGFHDAANSIATVVSTHVLTPGQAVVWAAFFNFVAFLVLGQAVAKAIGGGMVDIKAVRDDWQLWVLLCGLIGAIAWDLLTWYLGLPTSSSHAIVGVGTTRRVSAVRRGIAGNIVWAWILTIPGSAAIAAGSFLIARLFV